MLPRGVDEVVDAVELARRHRHLPLAIRSGGHGISGRSTNEGGIVDEVDQVGLAFLTYRVQDPAGFLVAFGEVASGAPRDTPPS